MQIRQTKYPVQHLFNYHPKILIFIIALILLAPDCARAKSDEKLPDSVAVTSPLNTALAFSGKGGGITLHLTAGVLAGYLSTSAKSPNINYTAGNFLFDGDIGVMLEINPGYSSNVTMIWPSVFLSQRNIDSKYKDAAGKTQTDKLSLTTFGFPVTYLRMNDVDGVGHFWQVGLRVGINSTATDGSGATITKQFNNIYFEPTIGCGITVPYEVIQRSRHSSKTVETGKMFFGPYASYVATNLSAVSGTTMHQFAVGLLFSYCLF